MIRIISALIFVITSIVTAPAFAADAVDQAAQKGDKIQLADNAPDSYTIVKGDTLWAISSRFLKQPWRWPEVWGMNREQIKNPHWIYPGQTVVLDRTNMTLSIKGGGDSNTPAPDSGVAGSDRLSPRVYSTSSDSPITSVPMEALKGFLVEPLVLDEAGMRDPATVVAIEEDRVIAGTGDTIFAKNVTNDIDLWQIYRRAEVIKEPVTGEILGYEAISVGTASVTTPSSGNKVAALQVTSSKQEVSVDDRMLPAGKAEALAFVPHAPPANAAGRVVSIYGGLGEGGRNSIITLSVGKQQGAEPGQVFALYRNRGNVTYTGDGKKEQYDLPEERYGLVFVFRVFNHLSYALVLDSSVSVKVADSARAP